MSECSVMDKCAFYKGSISNMKEVGRYVKQLYCLENSEKCARKKNAGGRAIEDNEYFTAPWGLECTRKENSISLKTD